MVRAGAAVAAKGVAADLAWSVLKGQTLQAAAKQLAAAAAVLASPEQQAGLSADSLGRFRLRAGEVARSVTLLAVAIGDVVNSQQDRALAEALLTALRESRLLQHTGRLLLLLPPPPPGPGGEAAPQGLAAEQATAYMNISSLVWALSLFAELTGRFPSLELPSLLGPCGLHALLALGASTLAAADGGPRGLPRDPLLGAVTVSEGRYPCVTGAGMRTYVHALMAEKTSTAPSLSPRARTRLLVRLLQLAGASARAARGAMVPAPDGRLRVDLSWGGGRRRGSQEFARLLPPKDIGVVAVTAVAELTSASAVSRRAWAAEAPALLAPLFTSARHCVEALLRPEAGMAGAVANLLTHVARPLLRQAPRYTLHVSPSSLPAPMAAALEGGVVPLLETLLRAAGDDPAGPEAQMTAAMLSEEAGRSLVAVLAHSPPRQAAAFLATLAKLLRRTPPGAMLVPVCLGDGPVPPGAWLMLATYLVPRAESNLRLVPLAGFIPPGPGGPEPSVPPGPGGPEPSVPPGPVDPSAPCSPLFVLSLAALQLLPVVSRLTREAAQLAGAQAPPAETMAARAAAGGRLGAAGQGGEEADDRRPGLMYVLMETQLDLLAGARRPAGVGGSADPAVLTHVSASRSAPFLVEEAAAVPLLGALLAALLRDGELPGVRPPLSDLLVPLAESCVGVAAAYPERVRGEGGSGSSGAGGSSGASASASAAWSPAALRLLASRLRGSEPQLSEEVEALAARLEQPPPTAEPPQEGSPIAAELAAAAERLAALRAEVRAVLPPACSNPACVSLAGDSEAGLRLQQCSRCGRASYCCRECQVAHWKAGHKEACGGGGGGSNMG